MPFLFEPEFEESEQINNKDSSGEEESEDEENYGSDRLAEDTSFWCLCGRCEIMESAEMCLCCKELGSISHLTEGKNLKI